MSIHTLRRSLDDLDSPLFVFDRRYVDYDRYCALKRRGASFVTLLRSNAQTDVVEPLHDVEVHDETGHRRSHRIR
jgi:hypothetical protein